MALSWFFLVTTYVNSLTSISGLAFWFFRFQAISKLCTLLEFVLVYIFATLRASNSSFQPPPTSCFLLGPLHPLTKFCRPKRNGNLLGDVVDCHKCGIWWDKFKVHYDLYVVPDYEPSMLIIATHLYIGSIVTQNLGSHFLWLLASSPIRTLPTWAMILATINLYSNGSIMKVHQTRS